MSKPSYNITRSSLLNYITPAPDAKGPYKGKKGVPVQFNAQVYYGRAPYSFVWHFGDGHSATGQKVSHPFNRAGNFIVALTVTDSNGKSKRVYTNATIEDSPSKTIDIEPSDFKVNACSSAAPELEQKIQKTDLKANPQENVPCEDDDFAYLNQQTLELEDETALPEASPQTAIADNDSTSTQISLNQASCKIPAGPAQTIQVPFKENTSKISPGTALNITLDPKTKRIVKIKPHGPF